MKHITTLIALALTLGTLVPLAAQTQMTAKEKRTQTRQERKIAQQKAREQLYQDAVRTLENNTFVLEADRLIFKRGRSVSVSSVKNFISMANKKPPYKSVLTPLVHFKTGWEVLPWRVMFRTSG